MATVIFYEKPGCINNTRQKRLLTEAGHVVDAYNLLTTDWQPEELRSYFNDMPLSEWFNPSAPAIRSGALVTTDLDAEQALYLMRQDPLLIRRPLLQIGEKRYAGFDPLIVDSLIGLAIDPLADGQDLESCSRTDNDQCEIAFTQPS